MAEENPSQIVEDHDSIKRQVSVVGSHDGNRQEGEPASPLSQQAEDMFRQTSEMSRQTSRRSGRTRGLTVCLQSKWQCRVSIDDKMMEVAGGKEGFFVALDTSAENSRTALQSYGIEAPEHATEEEMWGQVLGIQDRIVTCPAFKDASVVAAILSKSNMYHEVHGKPLPKYLWEDAGVVPFLHIDNGLSPERNGVCLIDDLTSLDDTLEEAVKARIFGAKARALIRAPDPMGIRSVVAQQFEIARRALGKKLTPILQPEVDIDAPEKALCEQILLDALKEGLQDLTGGEHVVFELTIPSKPNTYLPLTEHPNALRVLALSGGYSRAEACRKLLQNVGMIAVFGRAFTEGLRADQSDEDFKRVLETSCHAILKASRPVSRREEQTIKIGTQDGFFVSLDSDDRTKSLRAYGADVSGETPKEEVDIAWNDMLLRIVMNANFNGSRIIGAVLRSETMLGAEIDEASVPEHLWHTKRIVPFLRLPLSLQAEKDGVQMFQEDPKLQDSLGLARDKGMCGTKVRSVIHAPNTPGIKAMVRQQFDLALRVIEAQMVPILQFETHAGCLDKGTCERRLVEAIMERLGTLKISEKVVLDVPIPVLPNTFLPLIGHPNVLRVSALSGGVERQQACDQLALNIGLIAGFGRAFTGGLRIDQGEEDFAHALDDICKTLYQASYAVPTREEQTIKVTSMDGFFAAFDESGPAVAKTLERYGVEPSGDMDEMLEQLHQMRTRVITSAKFNGSRVIGVTLAEDGLRRQVGKMPIARYLWEQKNIVPFLKIGSGLENTKDGVQLMKGASKIDHVLDKAAAAGIFGTKARSVIKKASPTGIQSLVSQQFQIGKRVMRKGLTPVLMIEVDINAEDKAACENLLLHALLERMSKLVANEKLVFQLTIPAKPNLYLPLMAFPNTIRVVALSGGYGRSVSCKMLGANVGMVAGFGRALLEGLSAGLPDDQFAKALSESCRAIFSVSRCATPREEQIAKVSGQEGFIVACDRSASSSKDVLLQYGVHCKDDSVMDKIHSMRSRFITNSKFNGSRIIGTIITEEAIDRDIDYMPTAKYLWERKKIVPILKFDSGMEREAEGAQLVKDTKRFDELLDKAVAHGIYFTKVNSLIRMPNSKGIKAVVEQQVDLAKRVLARGLVPVMQIEVSMHSPDKAACERILRQTLMGVLNRELADKQRVVLVLAIPSKADHYSSLIEHPAAMRVAALSGGANRADACRELAANAALIGCFGRAFAEGLAEHQAEKEFTDAVEESCAAIYRASCTALPDLPPEKSVTPVVTPRSSTGTPRSASKRSRGPSESVLGA